MTDAELHDDARIGDLHNGWSVANTTLLYERASMGSGGGSGGRSGPMARPGTIAGDLTKRAGDFVSAPRPKPTSTEPKKRTSPAKTYIDLARARGLDNDPLVRQDLVRLHMLGEIARMSTERQKAARAAGKDVPGIANFSKLLMADNVRLQRDVGLRILGARGMLHGYRSDDRRALVEHDGDSAAAGITTQALGAQALPIYGGTDQIQRNIIAERVLGLPKEPGSLTKVPFNELPRNA